MLTDIWNEFLKIITQEVGSRVVETWLKVVTVSRWEPATKTLYLGAPNTFVKEWITSHYIHLMVTHLSRLLNVSTLKIVINDALEGNGTVDPEVKPRTHELIIPTKQGEFAIKRASKMRCSINKNYIFNTFIVGPSNSLAFAAAQAITQKPGKLYNPLFIYGGSGLGKTHLLHAIGNEIRNTYKKAEVLYQTTDRFVNEFIHAIRFDKVHQFQAKYKSIDVLLIDDVQFISNKEQTQEAFFHIFNSLYESHKQIVFSSDSYPADIKGLAERLSSRLECGLVADIQVPTIETKIAILKHKAANNDIVLPNDVAEFIASRVVSNIRELEGSLIRVMAYTTLTNEPICLELAQKVLLRNGQPLRHKIINPETILTNVSSFYQVPLADLKSERRHKQLSLARQVAMYLIKKLTHKTLYEISNYLNKKDHSTVIHALQRINDYKEKNHEFAERLKKLEENIIEG